MSRMIMWELLLPRTVPLRALVSRLFAVKISPDAPHTEENQSVGLQQQKPYRKVARRDHADTDPATAHKYDSKPETTFRVHVKTAVKIGEDRQKSSESGRSPSSGIAAAAASAICGANSTSFSSARCDVSIARTAAASVHGIMR